MQIIESTVWGVRSAETHLEGPDGCPDIVLYPMIHVGERQFYEDVVRRLEEFEVILCEGMKTPTVSLLSMSYRFFADNPRVDLVLQRSASLAHLKDRIVHADVSSEAFERRWSRLPFSSRFVLPMIAPVFGLYLRYFGTREFVARRLGINLMRSRDEILTEYYFEDAREVILDWRDQHLVGVIDREVARAKGSDVKIAIVFGATHMRAVLWHLLNERGYKYSRAEWMMVFGL